MNYLIWLAAGALVGWLAALVMGTDARQTTWLNVAIGIVGAFVAGFFITPAVGLPPLSASTFSLGALLLSMVAAVLLLIVVNVVRRNGRS